jgi:hypothetical protein
MPRFVLRYIGSGAKPPSDDVDLVRERSAIKVMDESARMLLVESNKQTIERLRRTLSDWQISDETLFATPDPTPSIKRSID